MGATSVINRLTLGDPDDDTIRATLEFDCQTPGQHGLFIGYRSPDSKRWIHRGASLTDENGLTPVDPERGAILVTLKRYQATDDPRMPQTTAFSYEMAIRRKRFKPRTMTLSAGQPIPRPLVIKLESKEP